MVYIGEDGIKIFEIVDIIFLNEKTFKIKVKNKIIVLNGENIKVSYFDNYEIHLLGEISNIEIAKI